MPLKKRLIILSGSYPRIRCGVAGHVKLIAERTAALNLYDIHVVTAADPAVDSTLAKGYTVHPVIARFLPFDAGRVCQQVLKREPDIVHIQIPTVKYTGWRSLVMSFVAKKLKKKRPCLRLVVMQHDIAVGRPLLRQRYRPLLSCADAITVSNERDRQAIIDLHIDQAKIHTAPVTSHLPVHPPDKDMRQRCRASLGIADDVLCVAFFGFIHPGRHIDQIIRTLPGLQQRGLAVHTIIMGQAAPGCEAYLKACQKLCEQLELTGQVSWTGYAPAEQIADGLAAADVFVSLPDRGADMRNTSIHTAMLAQLPIVTLQNEAFYVDKQIEEMGCYTIAAPDPQLLCEKIAEAYANPPAVDFRRKLAGWLDPERIWRQHIEVNCRAYAGQPPQPISAFAAEQKVETNTGRDR